MIRQGTARHGSVWQVRRVKSWLVIVRFGVAGKAEHGNVGLGKVQQGLVRFGRYGELRLVGLR